jgi:hypothetical protein
LLVGDRNFEINGCIDGEPIFGIKRQIISISFEIFRSIEILVSVKIDNDTIFVYSFADILDIKDKILIQGDSLTRVFGIDQINAWQNNIRFAFGHFCKIEIKGFFERIGFIRSNSLRTCS